MIFATITSSIFDGAREGIYMFWDTVWALVLGFGLSGMVQSFVTRKDMEKVLGDHKPGTIAKASALGVVSSSCSYAASAMTKSIFAKGADFFAAMAFMFASTNLVVELGIVLFVLIGWQFVAAEFIGGAIMIALLVGLGTLLVSSRAINGARLHVASPESIDVEKTGCASTNTSGESQATASSNEGGTNEKLTIRLRKPALWADAANYAISDLKMLRREMLIGYIVAGYLATVVPVSAWRIVFISGHGLTTQIENSLVGPIIAFLSFVCSVGNIPLAAALWKDGISFGGVISFVFADLVAFPLVMIYRRLYGTKFALKMVGLFWAVMSLAGFIIEEIFSPLGLVPTNRKISILTSGITFNYTSVLDVLFLLLFAGILWLAKNQKRFGGGVGYAIDPVCHMQVETSNAPATLSWQGKQIYFCSDNCKDRFEKSPSSFVDNLGVDNLGVDNLGDVSLSEMPTGMNSNSGQNNEHGNSAETAVDPVCGMSVEIAGATQTATVAGKEYYFCSAGCKDRFLKENA